MTLDEMLASLGHRPLPVGKKRSVIGQAIYRDARHIMDWPRSITGVGVRQTLNWIGDELGGLTVTEIPTGTKCFDWTVPNEWKFDEAWIKGPDGTRVVDTADTILHVLNYSAPVDTVLDRDELDKHLFSLPDMPDAVPYVTSYYKERWGFCLAHNKREALPDGKYRAVVRSRLEPGSLSIGELVIPGETDQEILISTYVCHPAMANNETSGIVVATMIARWLKSLPNRHYTYRVVFCPETIGAVCFLSLRYQQLQQRIAAGFVLTMLGDDRGYACTLTPTEDTLTDRVVRHVMPRVADHPDMRPHTVRVSDERQYCAPGIGWPVVALMRGSRYPEYHTDADDLSLVSPVGLYGGFELVRLCLSTLELNVIPHWQVQGEPQLSKHGLRGTIGGPRKLASDEFLISQLLAFSDGKRDLLAISYLAAIPIWEASDILWQLVDRGLLTASRLTSKKSADDRVLEK